MGLGFKYHVATIAAIFLALTVGLVVGSLFGSPRVPQTTVLAIEALKRSQATLEKNTSDVKQERDVLQTCLRQSLPFALKSRLNGLSVALVQSSGDAAGLTADVKDTLTQAGARIVSVTTLERAFGQPDEMLASRLAPLHANDSRLPTDRTGLAATIAGVFQAGDATPTPLMPLLQNADVVRSESESRYDAPVHTVVLLTGSRSEATSLAGNVDVPLIAALQKAGLAVYACEAQDVVTSGFPAYRNAALQVNAVERADTDPGRWQLVTALANALP